MLRCSIVNVLDCDGNVVGNRIELSLTPPPAVKHMWHSWFGRIQTAAL